MNRPDPVATARAVVAGRFPDAVQAWLSGSVVLGGATATSDLDITVLLEQGEARRESLVHGGWPIELFVHTESSIRHFVVTDRARRRPTMARLVATGIPLLDGFEGRDLQQECAAVVAAGPGPVSAEKMDLARYMLTDQLDDLAGGASAGGRDATVVEVWRLTAELLLAASGRWGGGGKWLIREVEEHDRAAGTRFAERLHAGLHAALDGDVDVLVDVADAALDLVGGRLWQGFVAHAPRSESG